MRNFKKVLALVLALAMTLTMFAGAIEIPAKASDYDSLSAAGKEAYDVLSGLGVIAGYPDGSVKGDVVVSRAEMAKMIYVLKTGDVDGAGNFYGNATVAYNDVASHWALTYINYCDLNGIIAGYGDGTFRPDSPVTGTEAAKMLLVALGKNPVKNGLVGSAWASNTMRLAGLAGLLKNIYATEATMALGLDRDGAMIMMYNAVYAETEVEGATENSKKITLGEEGFDLLDVTAVLVANDHGALGMYWNDDSVKPYNATDVRLDYVMTQPGYSRFVFKDYVATNAANQYGAYEYKVITAKVSSDFADLGTEYRILTTNLGNAYNSSETRTVYSIIGESTDTYKAVNGTRATVKWRQDGKVVEVDGKDMLTDGTFLHSAAGYTIDATIFVNKEPVDAIDSLKTTVQDNNPYVTIYTRQPAAVAIGKQEAIGNSTAPVRYIDNDADGIIDTLLITEYTLGTVSAIEADGDVVVAIANFNANDYANDQYDDLEAWERGFKTISASDLKLTNGELAVGDYVAYYETDYTFVKKLDKVEGSISGYSNVDKEYTVNGVAYQLSELATARAKQFVANGQYALDNTQYTFITDEDANSHFIVDVLVNTNTSYGKYALVESVSNYGYDTYLNQGFINLFTADNKIERYIVASINGFLPSQSFISNANTAYAEALANLAENTGALVSYIVDGDYAYITTADYGVDADAFGTRVGSFYVSDWEIGFDSMSNTWYDSTVSYLDGKGQVVPNPNYGGIYNTDSATIFAVRTDANGDVANYTVGGWRAYKRGEFYGIDSANDIPLVEIIATKTGNYGVGNSSVTTTVVKAMVVAPEAIPATVLGQGGKIILVDSVGEEIRYDATTGIRTMSIKTIPAFGETAETFVYSTRTNLPSIDDFQPRKVYKVNVDENNILTECEELQISAGSNVEDYIPNQLKKVIGFSVDAYGTKLVSIEDNKILVLPADATIFTVKNMGCSCVDAATKLPVNHFDKVDGYALFNSVGGFNNAPAGTTISYILDAEGDIAVAYISINECTLN